MGLLEDILEMKHARPLGKGKQLPAGSIKDHELSKMCSGYKRTIASRYRAIRPDELELLPQGSMLVSPKIDGEMWFLFAEDGEVALLAPNGKAIIGDVPVLKEAAKHVGKRARGRLVLAGELFAVRKEGRPRVGDLGKATGGEADANVGVMGFHAFDLLIGGDATNPGPMPDYTDRLDAMRRLMEGGKRAQAIKTEKVDGREGVQERFEDWVEGGKGEGLVIRPKDGRTFKLKPVFTLDAAVIGFTERAEFPEQVRSMLLALIREDGGFQIIGSCGNMGTGDDRHAMFKELQPDVIDSGYRYASSSGALFKFVRPKVVIQIKVTDIQTEDSSGKPIKRMVLELDREAEKWKPLAPMAGVSIIHPVLDRIRDDKEVNATDVRVGQVLERVAVTDIQQKAARIERPKSEILRREVWVKTTKGKQAVRKLLIWKTNKEGVDSDWPAYVVHWTDYSFGRKDPLKREVRLAPDETVATEIAEAMIVKGVKRGWKAV